MATEGIHPTFRGGEGRGGGANSPYAQALLETATENREDKREFDERLELFKTAMALQREQNMQEHQKMIEAHQLAMEQHQIRMEQAAMERDRINAEKMEKKEADENRRELIGLRIQNELDPSALNYTQKRAELMKDPEVLSAITGTQGAAVYKLLKDSDKEHKEHATYWQTVLKDNHVQGDYRNPDVIPQDEDGRPVWNDDFQKRLQQGNLDFQRQEAQRPLTTEEQTKLDTSRKADWNAKTGGLDYRYSQARLNMPNPRGVTAKTGFIDANTNKFTPDPAGDFVQYTDATKKGFVSAPIPRNVHDEHNTYFQQGIQKQVGAEEQLGVQATPGVMSIEDPVKKEQGTRIDLSDISFGVAPKAGMQIKTTGGVPLPTQGSQEATAGSTKPAQEAVMGNEMIQSAAAGGGQSAAFPSVPDGQPKSTEPSPVQGATPAPAHSATPINMAPEGSINAQNKAIDVANYKRGFIGSLEHMFSNETN